MDRIKVNGIIKGSFLLTFMTLSIACFRVKESADISFLLPEGSECLELVNADSLVIDTPYKYRDLFDNQPVLVINNIITVLSDSVSSPIALPFNRCFFDIHWYDGLCYFSSDSSIFYGESNGMVHPIVSSDAPIGTFSISDERIVFPIDSLLLEYIFGDEIVTCLINTHENISHVLEVPPSVIYSSGRDLSLVLNDSAYRIYCSQDNITSFAVHSNGCLFVGTDSGLTYISPEYNVIEITTAPIKDLTLIDDDLYIIFSNNSSVKVTNVSNYQELMNREKADI